MEDEKVRENTSNSDKLLSFVVVVIVTCAGCLLLSMSLFILKIVLTGTADGSLLK